MAAALGYRPDGTSARLCFHLQADSYDTDSLIEVLSQLAAFYAGQRVVLLWDGLSAHWSYKMRTHLHAQRHWLTVERLPPMPRSSTRLSTTPGSRSTISRHPNLKGSIRALCHQAW